MAAKDRFLVLFGLIIILLVNTNITHQSSSPISPQTREIQDFYNHSDLLYGRGDYAGAIEVLLKVSDASATSLTDRDQIEYHMRLGILYLRKNDFAAATKSFEDAVGYCVSVNLNQHLKYAQAAVKICEYCLESKSHLHTQNLRLSEERLYEALDIAQKMESKVFELKCLRLLSTISLRNADLTEFISINERMLNLAKESNDINEIKNSSINIGTFYAKKGNYSLALSFLFDALDIAEKGNHTVEVLTCLNNISSIYLTLGEYKKAIDLLSMASNIESNQSSTPRKLSNLNNLGTALRKYAVIESDLDYLEKSRSRFTEMLELSDEQNDIKSKLLALMNIGKVYYAKKDYSNALVFFRRAFVLKNQTNTKFPLVSLYNNLGFTGLALNNLEFAEQAFHLAIFYDEKSNEKSNHLWETYFGLGIQRERQNRKRDAIEYYEKSIKLIESYRENISFDLHSAGYMHTKLPVFENLISLYFDIYSTKKNEESAHQMYFCAERAKSRAFLDFFEKAQLKYKKKDSAARHTNKEDIVEEITKLTQVLTVIDHTDLDYELLRRKLIVAESKYTNLVISKRSKPIDNNREMINTPIRIHQIQSLLLDDKSALIEYYLGTENSYLFIATKENIIVFKLPSKFVIRDSLKGFIKCLSDPKTDKATLDSAARRIYNYILFPLNNCLSDDIQNLIIVPDDCLFFLPFETLGMPIDDQFSYLISRYSISYLPSATFHFFLNNAQERNYEKKLLAFGISDYKLRNNAHNNKKLTPPIINFNFYENRGVQVKSLPFAEKEVRTIARHFPQNQRDLFLNDKAMESDFKKISEGQYQIIHLACHAIQDASFPLHSSLIFSLNEQSEQDGFLQIRELYGLNQQPELVVLSACQTGTGKLLSGEYPISLTRMFLLGGARSVVSSLWGINDKFSVFFMNRFYKFLSYGNSKTQALRMAKLDMLESDYSHPYYWGAYILNGEHNSTIF